MVLADVHGFDSPAHFAEFVRILDALVLEGELATVPVERPYAGPMFEESWYRTASGQIWRLVSPQFPFKGLFEQVE